MASDSESATQSRRVAAGGTRPDVLTLRSTVEGEIVLPDEPGWDGARQAWNLAADQRPFAVALVGSVDDVIEVVGFARAYGLRIAPQRTGHGASSLPALDDTILLKTSRLRGVEIDAEARRARVEAGALWGDVIEPAAEQGFVVLHGTSPGVGVVGYTLGGGIGWLARSRGLAANSVNAIELVTADGRLVRADGESEPDLFWAVRGGGGNFGVVTAIELELFDTPDLYAGALFWPVDRAGVVLRAWRDWVETVPDEVTSVGRVLHLPPIPEIPEPLRGGSFVVVEAVFALPESNSAELLTPLRRLEPQMDTFAMAAPTELSQLHMDPPEPVPGVGDGMLLEQLPVEAIDAIIETAVPPLFTFEVRPLGGALAKSSAGDGAIGSFDAEFAMFAAGLAPPELRDGVAEAVDRATAALAPWESKQAYFNFSERPIDAARLYPAETHRRLRRIKAAYDPAELFLANHAIPPSRTGRR